MTNKPEFVDTIGEATQQRYRRVVKRVMVKPDVKEERRLSNWPPSRFAQWRLENLTPWKLRLKSWTFKDWD
jgi:hypothetical protein